MCKQASICLCAKHGETFTTVLLAATYDRSVVAFECVSEHGPSKLIVDGGLISVRVVDANMLLSLLIKLEAV